MSRLHNKGFTIIELVISIAIIGMLAAVGLYNYGTFNDNIAISSSSQEMAIAMRQAQIYALNVKDAGSGQFTYAYGIYFNPLASPTTYIIFADKNGDKKYTAGNGCGGAVTECMEKQTLRNGVIISSIGVNSGCASIGSAREMDVTFLRPNPDATIDFFDVGGGLLCSGNQNGKVILTSLKAKTATIVVENTGQIYAQ